MNIYFISDTHFYHQNIIKNGGRPFGSVEEMNAVMVERWNKTIKPTDTVYHLGDVAMWKPAQLEIVKSLHGLKYLIRGNHDNYHFSTYYGVGFRDILSYKEFKISKEKGSLICSHIPLRNAQDERFTRNVHGHVHQKSLNDPFYFNVSVEVMDYTPISLDELRERL